MKKWKKPHIAKTHKWTHNTTKSMTMTMTVELNNDNGLHPGKDRRPSGNMRLALCEL